MSNASSSEYKSKIYKNGYLLADEDMNNIINGIDKLMAGEFSKTKALYMGKFEQAGFTATGLNYSAGNRVSMHDAYCVPYDYGITISIKLPENIWMGIRHGAQASNMSTNSYWLKNGDTFTFPKTSKFYRCAFAYVSNPLSATDVDASATTSQISPTIIEEYISAGLISLSYEAIDISDVVQRNFDNESYIKALMVDKANSLSGKRNDLFSYPIICHTSDIHGDFERTKNFFKYSKYLNADMNFITGDMVGYTPENGSQFLDLLDKEYGKGNSFVTLGNHDTYNTSLSQMYENVIQPFHERNGYVCNKTTYYYKDISAHSLRIIALSPYDYTNAGVSTNCKFSQEQINWFIETLKSTPAKYGICILMHPPMASYANITKPNKQWQHYTNGNLSTPPFWEQLTGISGQPIIDIVDAFISRTTISDKTYTNSDSTTFTVDGDFTEVDNTVEFIAHFNGHTHCDVIGYYTNAKNPQVVCNVCCGTGCYGTSSYPFWANICDVARGLVGKTQDAFNVYVIDRANHSIRVGRVGSDVIPDGNKRDFMTIDYKNVVTG